MAKLTAFGTEADSAQLRKVAEQVEAAAAGVKALDPKLLARANGGTVVETGLYLGRLAQRLRRIASYVDRHAAEPVGEGADSG